MAEPMTPEEFHEVEQGEMPVYQILVSVRANELTLSGQRNSLAYMMLSEQGRESVDAVIDAMIQAGTAEATRDCVSHETIVDHRPTVKDVFDSEVIDE